MTNRLLSRSIARRHFLIRASAFLVSCSVCGLGRRLRAETAPYPATLSGGAPCGSCAAPNDLTWKAVIPPPDEPGQPLVLAGTIFQPDGVTPARGYVLFVYQTDRTGYYNQQDDASHPRLRGWMKTGADGRYEFRTIRPGAYPRRDEPAHIHAHVYANDYSERSIPEFWFKDDPRITPAVLRHLQEIGEAAVIVDLTRDHDGVWRGKRDIKLPAPH